MESPHRDPTQQEAADAWRAREILEHRGLGVVRHPDGWGVRDTAGGRVGVDGHADPVRAAIEAERVMVDQEASRAERSARELLHELDAGAWYPRPREVDTGDPENPRTTLWDVVTVSGEETSIAGEATATAALLRARAELGAAETSTGGRQRE